MANWVRHPLPFLSVSPLESMRTGGKGVSQRYLRDTLWKQSQTRAIPTSAILTIWGVSRIGPLRPRHEQWVLALLSSPCKEMTSPSLQEASSWNCSHRPSASVFADAYLEIDSHPRSYNSRASRQGGGFRRGGVGFLIWTCPFWFVLVFCDIPDFVRFPCVFGDFSGLSFSS